MTEPVFVDVILSALAAGAGAAATDVAAQSVKDAYGGLKALIRDRFTGNPVAEQTLAKYENDPQGWRTPMHDVLVESGAAEAGPIVERARQVIELIRAEQTGNSKFNIQNMGNVQGQVVGDHAHQENIFGRRSDD